MSQAFLKEREIQSACSPQRGMGETTMQSITRSTAIRFFSLLILMISFFSVLAHGEVPAAPPGASLHVSFENESELLADFVSQSGKYKPLGRDGLAERKLAIEPGQFGNCVHIMDGWPVSKGTWNESGLDCDLIVAVMWGEWHKKPHFWGSGGFYGDRGTVAFWVKKETLYPGVVFMQGSVAWGRKERDLFTVEVDADGKFSAHIRDVRSQYHRVDAAEPTWVDGEWQHVAVVYDRAYGLKLYHNGRCIASNWGKDAWWMTTYPGLFSPFLPESWYDEVCFFDYPLSDKEVRALFEKNTFEPSVQLPALDEAARDRAMKEFGDVGGMELPAVRAAGPGLCMRQIEVEECSDGTIPACWVFDGRYELAWPHPYRLFTFILGDVDFHGTKIDVHMAPGEQPNYVAFEGTLSGLKLLSGQDGKFNEDTPVVDLGEYSPFFYAKKVHLAPGQSLRVPLITRYGLPEELEGSARFPLSGPIRIHEMHLWDVEEAPKPNKREPGRQVWYLSPLLTDGAFQRYEPALRKLKAAGDRTVVSSIPSRAPRASLVLNPLQAVHLASPLLTSDLALDAMGITLLIKPRSQFDTLWLRLRDPGNPARLWAQVCLRAEFDTEAAAQPISIRMDILDLMVACEDRILLEFVSANGCELVFGDQEFPSALTAIPSRNPKRSLEEYVNHEMTPARMQYMKEYNYRPWRFTGEEVSIQAWNVFGGPYDMAYPPLAILRHDPDNRLARTYKTLLFDRNWFGAIENRDPRRPMSLTVPEGAPAWAVWQRELYALNRRVAHWIVSQQREDGSFWGGVNDDTFIPLGWAALPLLGDEPTRRSWLRLYDGMEEMGIFYDGYSDIWPIDPLHITDFITSRGLMIPFALGDPHVLERELRTAERYAERVNATNERRAQQGLPSLKATREERAQQGATLVEVMEAEILNYSKTHVFWYLGLTPKPEPYRLSDRVAIAKQMMDAVQQTDDAAVFGFTEARVHTDTQRGIGRDVLVAATLGGRVQGRIEPFPPSIAVSWEGVETEDLARLVSYADHRTLCVNLYNFGERPIVATMRLWRIEKGRYEIAIGPDLDDDGAIDFQNFAHAFHAPETRELKRFSTLPLQIPPRVNTALTIAQIEPLPQCERLPDLAVSQRDCHRKEGAMEVVVHNLGAAPAQNVVVSLVDNGHTVATKTIDIIETPVEDLAARHVPVVFELTPPSSDLEVVVDPDNGIEEIFEENNTATLRR